MQIKRLEKNNTNLLFKYLKNNFKSDHIFYKSNKLFDWQYLSKNDYNFYTLQIKNNIKAVQGYIPTSRYDKKLISPTNFSNWKSNLIINNFKEIFIENEIMKIDHNIFKFQYPKKTNKYILNRYFKHPFYEYNIYKIESNKKTIAIFVTRICKFNKKTAIRIVDFFGKIQNFHHGKYLFRHLLKKNNSEFIDIYSYGIPKLNLAKSGLDNVEKYKKNKIIIPNYFEPFLKENVKLPYAFKASKKIEKKVRFFKGDSDLDRPNILK